MPRAVARPAPAEDAMPAHLRTFIAEEWPRGWRPAEPGEETYAEIRARCGLISWNSHRRLWLERQE